MCDPGCSFYDLSPLLTMGTNTGPIAGTTNPCTGNPYNYGEVYDPTTWNPTLGCASPFPGNKISDTQVSGISKNIASIYSQYFQKQAPLNRLTNGNFPSYVGSAGQFWKRRVDVKVDHNFSDRNHLSASYNLQTDESDSPMNFNTSFGGPWGGWFANGDHSDMMVRVVDNYSVKPTVINTFSLAWNLNRTEQLPTSHVNGNSYGFSTNQNFSLRLTFTKAPTGALPTEWDSPISARVGTST